MNIKSRMPKAPTDQVSGSIGWDIVPAAYQKWNPGFQAAASSDNDIGIYEVIGDYWGEGVTAKRIAAALRSIGSTSDVVVNINSPGGDLFEGLAIYNLLRAHQGHVTVRVMGMAASAASVIAMAADELQIARAGFLMIHNAWVIAMGNRNDLREVAETLEPFDSAMAGIYQTRTGIEEKEIKSMMDAETWIGGADAVDHGFADDLLPSDQIAEREDQKSAAIRKADVALAKAGMPRSERRKLFNELKASTHDAAGDHGTHDAAAEQVVAQYGPLKLDVNFALFARGDN